MRLLVGEAEMMGAPGQRVGYIRVSSFDQNPDRQRDQLDQVGVHRTQG